VLENRVLRRIFLLKSHDVTVGWEKLPNELHNLLSLPIMSIIRMIKLRMR
jgi:hypothetical protein